MEIPEKAYTAECTTCPVLPTHEDALRLYSMRFCPYSHRIRLVLAHKGIKHETANINLRSKPGWYLSKNPMGKVPALEFHGKLLYESAICNDYLDELYPQNKLNPDDPYTKARHKMLLEHFNVVTGIYGKCLHSPDQVSAEDQDTVQKELDRFERELGDKKFFGGDKLSVLDFNVWPWFERMQMTDKLKITFLPRERFPRLTRWMENMQQTEAVQKAALPLDVHRAFVDSIRSGKPDYDVGL